MAITPTQLISPDSELAQLFLQWSEDTDSRTWNIANQTNELIEELEGGIATRQDIYKAVAYYCKGQKPNTIRRLAEVAADYPDSIQRKYKQLLSFQHFKVSRRLFNEGYTPTIDYGLQWCVEGNDDKLNAGKFHTVNELLANFLPSDEYGSQLSRTWNKVKESLYDNFLLVDNDFYRQQLLDNWKEIEYVVKELDKLEKGVTIEK
jgi:hypothetical protein